MIKAQEIQEIIKMMDDSTIDELVLEQENLKLELRKSKGTAAAALVGNTPEAPPAPVMTQPAPSFSVEESSVPSKSEKTEGQEEAHAIVSPMVGTFYRSSSPDSDPYVRKGDPVTGDSVVCIVEAMKLFNEIEAEVDGTIIEILAEDGELVEYGQPLFLVELR